MNKWLELLPDEIKASIIKGLEQSNTNQIISHKEAMKPYLKWLRKPSSSPDIPPK